LGYEAGLRHGAIHCIYQQQYAVYHGEHSFDFATKIGMSGGIYNIDSETLPINSGVFRQNRYAPLPLLVGGIKNSLYR
jgi:hypothetical protein